MQSLFVVLKRICRLCTALKSKTHPSAPTEKLPISRAAKPPFAAANVPLLRSGDGLSSVCGFAFNTPSHNKQVQT